MVVRTFNDLFQDGPSGSPYQPPKQDMRDTFNALNLNATDGQTILSNLQASTSPILILVAGQSNAANRPSYAWTRPANLKMWTYFGSAYSDAAATTTVGTFVDAPENVGNFGMFIGEAAALANPNREVYVVNISKGGVPISTYLTGTADPDMYAALQANMTAALAEINAAHPDSNVDRVEALFWWQGEADASLNNLDYVSDFNALHARLRDETWFDQMTPVILSGFSRQTTFDSVYGAYTNSIKLAVASESRVRRYIDPGQFPVDYWDPTGDVPNIHMTGEGYRRAGLLAYNAWVNGNHEAPVPGITYSDYYDTYSIGNVLPNSSSFINARKDQAASTAYSLNNQSSSTSASTSINVSTVAGTLQMFMNNAATPVTRIQGTATAGNFALNFANASGQYVFSLNNVSKFQIASSGVLPGGSDNSQSLGTGSFRWSTVYAGTGTINTSDEREKSDIGGIPDEWLDAWEDVDWQRFRMSDAVEAKGDGARWHVGIVAQRVKEIFERNGIDAATIGLLCYDEWDDIYEDVVVDVPEIGEDGEPTGNMVPQATGEKRMIKASGNRYGIRYEEALAMEAALMRRSIKRLTGVSA